MKKIIIIAFVFSGFYVNAQIKGNKNIVSRSFDISQFESVYLGLYAQYELDMSRESSLEITIDENLIPFVEKEVSEGNLVINQLKWIAPSQDVVVKIGARGMKKLIQSAHSRTYIKNIDQDKIEVIAEVGDVFLEGKVKTLVVQVGTGDVDASKLDAVNGEFEYESWGTITANVSGEFESKNEIKGQLVLNGNAEPVIADEDVRFIEFVLKNNSANRHQFYVVGPKPDGSKFSYGFPMMPFQKRDKNWTNGTKVYKVNNIGLRKLVKVIRLEDEGQIVDIFEE